VLYPSFNTKLDELFTHMNDHVTSGIELHKLNIFGQGALSKTMMKVLTFNQIKMVWQLDLVVETNDMLALSAR
jgi:hypothetical protein